MSSHTFSSLEACPGDILEHIAYHCASSPFEFPDNLHPLLRSSPVIWRTLRVQSCPQLYANIFLCNFDLTAFCRRHRCLRHMSADVSNSELAVELLHRHTLIRRLRRGLTVTSTLGDDLRAALRLVMESDGLNEAHLSQCDASDSLVKLLNVGVNISDECRAMMMWFLCLTLSHLDVKNKSKEAQNALLMSCRDFIITKSQIPPTRASYPWLEASDERSFVAQPSLDASYPAIAMTFVLEETLPVEIPPHLLNGDGGTGGGAQLQDYLRFTGYRTPLFGDSRPKIDKSTPDPFSALDHRRSELHDNTEVEMFASKPARTLALGGMLRPGSLMGVWEGVYMMASNAASTGTGPKKDFSEREDFYCRKPMQCIITEWYCQDPAECLPETDFDNPSTQWIPAKLVPSEAGLRYASNVYKYQASSSRTPSPSPAASDYVSGRDMDWVLTGTTSPKHSNAWGGYKYVGRVMSDDTIELIRQPTDLAFNTLHRAMPMMAAKHGYSKESYSMVKRWLAVGGVAIVAIAGPLESLVSVSPFWMTYCSAQVAYLPQKS
ncbi:hypothetical protein FISHEDRAFT_77086 [Fistulina hepatica ATCC 64428]|uniref:F-box domain-containing protein n=1 Tax=Fistulina hepatica ATCC 64428 TaxID=1128425 RepID=A0A0D7A4P7_9AGAR|nr:hypothetical protein FISHEDRAFT_77086 [Fistulina hepatica ATCC 64428]